MSDVLFYLLLIVLVLVLGVLIGLLVSLIREDKHTESTQQRKPQMIYESPTAYGRCWHIEIWNYSTNQLFVKDFCGQVMLGRSLPASELFWQMRIGEDKSISREQCVIYDRSGYLVIENVSQVNMTRMNGYPITVPMVLQQGAQLTLGRSICYVSMIQRTA